MSSAAAYARTSDLPGLVSPDRDDPLDRLLDAFEVQVEALKDQGLEPQLRARLARLLPPPPATPAPAATPLEAQTDTRDELDLATVMSALKIVSGRGLGDANRNITTKAREIVLGWMKQAKTTRGAA